MKDKLIIKKTKIRVVGIGGGGGSIISELSRRVKKVSFVAANTDLQALRKLPRNIQRFKFGQDLTYGLGTGMDVEKGKLGAEKEKQRIKRILKDQDLCIFIACLGGGAGSGAAPAFTDISRELGNINLGIFTLPFKFEGERRIKIARDSLEKIKPHLNGFLIIQNQRIFRVIDKKSSLNQAFSALNKTLADNLASFIELIYKPGLINIDFADFRTILEGKGDRIYFNTAEAKGIDRADKVMKEILDSPLLDFNISTAKRILFNISGPLDLKMKEVEKICSAFSELNRQAKIIFGVSPGSSKSKSGIRVTLLVTGDKKRASKPKASEVKKAPKAKEAPKKKKRAKPKVKAKIKKKKVRRRVKKKVVKVKVKAAPKKRRKKKKKKRLSALEIKKAAQQEEERRWAEEEKWDVPAFLRRNSWKEKNRTSSKEKKKS